jgi:hypothetical protein
VNCLPFFVWPVTGTVWANGFVVPCADAVPAPPTRSSAHAVVTAAAASLNFMMKNPSLPKDGLVMSPAGSQGGAHTKTLGVGTRTFTYVAVLTLSGLSMLLVDPAPAYDPWAWLLWGREVAGGGLSTVDGPAFKPLPVAVCALLAPLGSVAAPWTWVLLVRVAAVVAALLAYDLGRRMAGGSRIAGALAAAGVLLCTGLLAHSAAGAEPALVIALGLGAAAAWREERFGVALVCAVACALLRVEAWPFVLGAGAVLWRRRPEYRALLAALGILVPAAWLVPELVGSGDLLRSGARARVANPGQPALADVPALAALEAAVRLPLWPLWTGVAALAALRARAALAPAAAGAAWIAIVALMAQAGFSGEPRYALPGAALIAISGAVGLVLGVRAVGMRPAVAVAVAVVALAAAPRLADLPALRSEQAYQWRLAADLADAVRAAGGRDAVLACGRPYVGPLRGPLMAYRLGVPKRVVEPDEPPRAPGVVFRSALRATAEPAPAAPAQFAEKGRAGAWQVLAACDAA